MDSVALAEQAQRCPFGLYSPPLNQDWGGIDFKKHLTPPKVLVVLEMELIYTERAKEAASIMNISSNPK